MDGGARGEEVGTRCGCRRLHRHDIEGGKVDVYGASLQDVYGRRRVCARSPNVEEKREGGMRQSRREERRLSRKMAWALCNKDKMS